MKRFKVLYSNESYLKSLLMDLIHSVDS